MSDSAEDRAFPLRCAAFAPALSLAEEMELVLRAKAEPAVFGELYEANYQAILNYLYRRTLSVTTAEELTSNTFFKALRGLPEFEPRPEVRFRSWLYRIATNELKMHWRTQNARPVASLLDESDLARVTFVWPEIESAEAVREKQRKYAVLHQALSCLPEPYQSAWCFGTSRGSGTRRLPGSWASVWGP